MEAAAPLREKAEEQHRLVQRALVAQNIAEALEKSLAPLGHYRIPGLLDRRRLEFGIPNGCFEHFPMFDKVYIWQLNMTERKTYSEGGKIIKPDARVAHDRATAARGVIVSAGLAALDSLRSTGVDIGHIVRFKKYSPFIQVVQEISGVELAVMTLRDGDCVSSEDLARDFHEGRVRIVNVSKEKGGYDHRFERTLEDGTVVTTGAKVAAYYDPSV
jgi:hypothetical protein